MWHEARKQERKVRGLMVDMRKRAERRRDFYERIKMDPTQFLRVNGRSVKIHLDPAIAIAAEGPNSMMPWQGRADVMIDRFDVRANLDYIPEVVNKDVELSETEAELERRCNYERYRILVQNEGAGVSEEQSLRQITVDEQFGAIDNVVASKAEEDKKSSANKAAIGFSYDEEQKEEANGEEVEQKKVEPKAEEENEDEEGDDEEADLDMAFDVNDLNVEQEALLNECSVQYGMEDTDFIDLLRSDREEAETLREVRLREQEKAMYSGRKSRRERRIFKDRRLRERDNISPPAYAARESPKYEKYQGSRSRSRSPTPTNTGGVCFITSFGGEEDDQGPAVVHGPALPQSMQNRLAELKKLSRKQSRSRSRSFERSPVRGDSSRPWLRKRSYSRSSSRSSSRSRRRRRRSTRSPSRSPSRGYARSFRKKSRSRSKNRFRRSRSRSRSESRSRSRSRSNSRKRSYRSRSRSRGRSSSYSSRSRSRSVSKSKSPSAEPTVKRYRRPSLSSNSNDDSSDEEQKDKSASRNDSRVNLSTSGKGSSTTNSTSQVKSQITREIEA